MARFTLRSRASSSSPKSQNFFLSKEVPSQIWPGCDAMLAPHCQECCSLVSVDESTLCSDKRSEILGPALQKSQPCAHQPYRARSSCRFRPLFTRIRTRRYGPSLIPAIQRSSTLHGGDYQALCISQVTRTLQVALHAFWYCSYQRTQGSS